ncbi:hypothetical protein [Pseudonocardia oroxyli]|uniref:Uncharacterized protein n=1 Tax=Pseudonocardia oroxyli TaxID=366584 RepID=A0A1G7LPW4_PSEOR|nr:hypothetical protein [Pseudonocardia oroxyli]SDF51572.1 hypothetical protein SAMN05216377_105149 [Pseudonocardia oroxyli]
MTSGGWLTRLAEAHAGLPDEATAARVLAAGGAGTDHVLRALDATRADLGTLGRERMPVALAGSLAAALDAADAETERTDRGGPPPAPPGRGPRRRRRGPLLTAAAAVLVGVVLTGPGPGPTDLAGASGRVLAERTRAVGRLADPAALASCLLQAGVAPPTGALLAGRPLRLNGLDGLLIVLSTGKKGVVRAVVVTPDCGRLLADQTVGE